MIAKKTLFNLVILIVCLVVNLSYAQDKEEKKEPLNKLFLYSSNNKRDPLMPLVNADGLIMRFEVSQTTDDMHLQGIVLDSGKSRYAIINSEIYQENDMLGDYKLIKIEENRVVLVKGEEKFIINIETEEE